MSRAGTIGTWLAPSPLSWHGARMEKQSGSTSRAGGAIIAFSILAGAIIGARQGQPSAGTVIGAIVGTAITLALYFYDRRRG